MQKRTKIKCPRCNDAFYLGPDGRVEARLEGNTTAVLSPLDTTPRPLIPPDGSSPTPSLGQPPLSKTQPISRAEVKGSQQQLLDDLKPKQGKPLDFVAKLPERRKDADLIDTDAYAGSAPLELVPTGAPAPAPRAATGKMARPPAPPPAAQQLSPNEEGQVDLDLEGLKRKTQKYARTSPTASGKGATRGTDTDRKRRPEEAPAAATPAPEPAPVAEPAGAPEEPGEPEDPRRAEKERRAAEAARRAADLEREAARRGLSTISLLLLALLPAVIGLGLAAMTSRGSGFAVRGSFGEGLRDLGMVVERGVRSFGSTVNPALPDGWKLPSIEQQRR